MASADAMRVMLVGGRSSPRARQNSLQTLEAARNSLSRSGVIQELAYSQLPTPNATSAVATATRR